MPPVDQKRINGPENSVPYQLYLNLNVQTYKEKYDQIISNETRKNGRKFDEARKIFFKAGVITQSKGSAYIEMGDTKVIVAVFDPREIPKQNQYSIHGDLFCDFKYAAFSLSSHRKPPITDSDEKTLAQAMTRALQPAVCRHEFPNFQVDIFANVLQNDGSVLGAAITCAGLALADAGIPMFDIVTAATVGVIGAKFLLDPTDLEEQLCNQLSNEGEHGLLVMSRLSTHEQISEFYQTGNMSLETVQKATDILIESNKEYIELVKQILVTKVLKTVKNSEKDGEQKDNKINKQT